MGIIDNKQAAANKPAQDTVSVNPKTFKTVGKSHHKEGWLLVQSHKVPNEWRVRCLLTQKKYVMLYDKLLFVFDEDKLHMRVPKSMLNFDQQWFVLENTQKNSAEFK